jgi:uncharacterized lipoprotein YehR (DUF1307 family)
MLMKSIASFVIVVALAMAILLPGCTKKEVEKKHEINVDTKTVVSQQPVIE